ncbi:MAG: hypothetical protein KF817_13770 [Phycisphaeraceae bacterium]|nr:hypothetical protein [Phycisphaeraceae bacterium]
MGRLLVRVFTAIQLTRLSAAFGAVSDIWFIVLLQHSGTGLAGSPTLALPWALAASALVAIGLYACGASLNDVLDVRQDATFSPDRPIPAGRIKAGQAVVVAVAALIVAVLGAALLGVWAVCVTMVTATGILFYNATGKYIPSVGILTLGLVHAAHMFIPARELVFTLPVWLVMTHTMVVHAAVYRFEDKRPRFTRRAVTVLVAGWVGLSLVLLLLPTLSSVTTVPAESVPVTEITDVIGATGRDRSRLLLACIPPLIAVAGFVLVARWKTKAPPRAAAEKLRRYGALWQSLYSAAWLLGLGLLREALWLGLFALLGFGLMTIIREVSGYGDRQIGYRMR